MRRRSDLVLQAFLSRCAPDRKRELEKFLPPSQPLPELSHEISPEHFANGNMLEKVHWSWFLPTLKTYTEEEQQLFLSVLSHTSAKNLAKALNVPFARQEITEIARLFLRQILLQSLLGPKDSLLPIDYLPITSLTPMLQLSKKELIRLIDFLSLYDLADEQKRIVETKILKKIYSFLSEEERKFLKNILAHQEPFPSQRMGLDRWDGTEESFRTLLHRRGLMRLGAALSGQDPDFIWYVCHQLDIGRGNALFKLCAKEAIPVVSSVVIEQIEELLR